MEEGQQEVLQFDGVSAPIYRTDGNECYIALRPPDAMPYVVAPRAMKPEDVVAFVQERVNIVVDLRGEMQKRYRKSPSLQCRFQTGDVAYLLGRPFTIKVYPTAKNSMQKVSRGRATVSASLDGDVSVLRLFVMQTGNYDQCRGAFFAWAERIYLQNMVAMMADCVAKTESEIDGELRPIVVDERSIHRRWVQADWTKGVVSFSRVLIAYPAECSAYVFLSALAQKVYGEDASEEELETFVSKGCPTWQRAKEALNQEDSIFAKQ